MSPCHTPFRHRCAAPGRVLLALLIAVLASSGCARIAALEHPTATPLPTATLRPTFTPLPSATPTPAASPTPSVTPTPTLPPLAAELALEPQLAQGGTALLRVTSNVPATASGTVGDRDLGFVSRDGLEHMALIGVDAIAGLNRLPVAVTLATDAGETLALDTALQVVAGEFETEYLVFEPETDALLEPSISQPEFARVAEVYAGFAPEIRWEGPVVWPLPEPYVTSAFGTRRQYGDRFASYHAGIDLRAWTGTPLVAAANGVVVLAEALQVRGNAVILDHGAGVFTGYFHLDTIGVEVGQEVAAGEEIATAGATGLVTGAHLHWEVRVGGVAVSPSEWTEQEYR
ncbi:MAG: M23 family metallopeptidase [Chloroflexi bacterium]|nr:M23 family metallopeptidase [Chloroflexota bacterium]